MSNIDTTYTKIFVGGLAWKTSNEGLRSFFQQFGEITHANVVYDRETERSKGYGFVTFKDAESATRACVNPNPTIDERTANCKLASDDQNVNHNNQFNNITGFPHDDLCHRSPTFMQQCQLQQLANLYQPYYWNHHYQQYYPQWQHYAPYALQFQYAPWYAPQCVPQYGYNQDCSVVNTNMTHLPQQSVNEPRENREASQASVSSSSPSKSRSEEDDN